MSKIFEQLLRQRHLDPSFLHPKYENLADPFIIPDMDRAVSRIEQAIKSQEKILIYGDYDADGVTSSTLMEQTLVLAGIKPERISIMLPNRFTDGYGMSPRLVDYTKEHQTSLVITVDCGSRNHEIIDQLNALNVDTIITDHHETSDTLPSAVAVVNPKRNDYTSTHGVDHLAGVGVAFKVAQALVARGHIPVGQEKWLLDLVLIGTICDSMILDGDNRILCYYGFKVLDKTRRPGLRELMRLARVKNLNTDCIGFQIGPRLNAAGRLQSADLSLNLLRSTSAPEAARLASQLEELNNQRRSEQISATREISERGASSDPVIIEAGQWHEGIVGIIAGRLVEEYQRPAFVLTEVEDGIYKGSGRSFGDFSLAEALNHAKDTIIGGGGHAGAAGVRLEVASLDKFRTAINDYYRSLHLKDQLKYLKQQPDLTLNDFSELNLQLLEELKTLEPYGPGNEEPIFRLSNIQITSVTKMGSEGQHLRLDIADKHGKYLKLVAFYAPENWLNLTPETHIEPLVKLTDNEWNGVHSLEARLVGLDLPNY